MTASIQTHVGGFLAVGVAMPDAYAADCGADVAPDEAAVLLPQAVMDAHVAAVVARHLAEAGAVHPKVHTPNRVRRWLAEHGWERSGGSDVAARWQHALGGPSLMDVYVPLNPDAIDYARRVRDVLQDGTLYDGTPLSQVLVEAAAMPDEVAE